MTKQQIINHIFTCADAIADIVEDYDQENAGFFLTMPDPLLQKMASVLTEVHRHLDQSLGMFQPEFDKFKQQEGYGDDD